MKTTLELTYYCPDGEASGWIETDMPFCPPVGTTLEISEDGISHTVGTVFYNIHTQEMTIRLNGGGTDYTKAEKVQDLKESGFETK